MTHEYMNAFYNNFTFVLILCYTYDLLYNIRDGNKNLGLTMKTTTISFHVNA